MVDSEEFFPCPVCSILLPISTTKNGKPYLTCNDCYVQLFVRGKAGIKKFKTLLENEGIKKNTRELISLIDYLAALEERLAEIQSSKPFFGTDADLELQEQLLKNQLAKLQKTLKKTDSA